MLKNILLLVWINHSLENNLRIWWCYIFRINLDIEFPRFPCEIISLDLQDEMMSHHPNIGSVQKYRLDSQGNYIDSGDFELLR